MGEAPDDAGVATDAVARPTGQGRRLVGPGPLIGIGVALVILLIAGVLVVTAVGNHGTAVARLEGVDATREDAFTESVALETTRSFDGDEAATDDAGPAGSGQGGASDARLTVLAEATWVASLATFDQSVVTLREVDERLQFVPGIKAGAVDAKTEVLDTSVYDSLEPGSWMVFVAPFDDEAEAAEYCERVTNVAPDCTPALVEDLVEREPGDEPDPPPEPDAAGFVRAAAPGLYAGTAGAASCDQRKLIRELRADPQTATAWSTVLGVDADRVGSYIRSLTAVTLRVDVLVTNHGLTGGQATPFASVLEAGSAVLIDNTGTPRTRCTCGGPLTPAEPDVLGELRAANARVDGEAWENFDASAAIMVKPAAGPLDSISLVDERTGRTIRRPFATTGDEDLATTGEPPPRSTSLEPLAVSASSSSPPSNDACGNPVTYAASNVADRDASTAWQVTGDGAGQTITVELPPGATVTSVGLVPGYDKVDSCQDIDRYPQNRRVAQVSWRFGTGDEQVQDLDVDDREVQHIDLDAVQTRLVTMEIVTTVAGWDTTGDTAVSEIEIVGYVAGEPASPASPATTTTAPPPAAAGPLDRLRAAPAVTPADYRGLDWGGTGTLVAPSGGPNQVAFESPSGNIRCIWSDASFPLTCDVAVRADEPSEPPGGCGEISWAPNYLHLSADGLEDGFCTGGQEVPLGATVLPYGSALLFLDFGCLSEQSGVMCVHLPTGRAFTAAQAGVHEL